MFNIVVTTMRLGGGATARQPLPFLSALLLSASVTKTSELMMRTAGVAVCCETYAEHIIIIIIITYCS